MVERKLWFLIAGIFILGVAVFTIGIVQAFQVTTINKSTTLTEEEQSSQDDKQSRRIAFSADEGMNIAVMGDSIARGTGDQSGKGVTSELVKYMEEQGIETEVKNIAVNGFVTKELLDLVQLEESQNLLTTMDVAILSIGGNNIGRLLNRETGLVDSAIYQEKLAEYIDDLQLIINKIRDKNKETYIIFIGLYNPYDSVLFDRRDAYMDYFFEWNYETQKLVDRDPLAVYVPSYDLFKWNLEDYLSYDGIHLNAEGYQVLAERIANIFKAANLRVE